MKDLTKEVPIQRMSVARGRLTGVGDAGFDLGVCEAAAKLGVKNAAAVNPDLHAIQATHIQVDIDPAEDGVDITVTVQATARDDLDGHALAGVAAGLLAARTSSGADARMEMFLVQNVA